MESELSDEQLEEASMALLARNATIIRTLDRKFMRTVCREVSIPLARQCLNTSAASMQAMRGTVAGKLGQGQLRRPLLHARRRRTWLYWLRGLLQQNLHRRRCQLQLRPCQLQLRPSCHSLCNNAMLRCPSSLRSRLRQIGRHQQRNRYCTPLPQVRLISWCLIQQPLGKSMKTGWMSG